MGKELRETKKKRALKSLEVVPPTADEAAMMHDLFLKNASLYGKHTLSMLLRDSVDLAARTSVTDESLKSTERKTATPANVVFTAETRIRSANLMHPQYRNLHNKVFGGKLMSLAYETAYSTACLFARSPVTFVALE